MHRLTQACVALVLVSVATPGSTAAAQRCAGADPDAAARHYQLGRQALEEAVAAARARDESSQRVGAEEALRHFEEQCAAGDDSALERQAQALLLLGRGLEAAQRIDEYLRLHPLEELMTEVRLRIERNRPTGALLVSGAPEDAQLQIEGIDFGPAHRRAAIYLPPGEYLVSAADEERRVAVGAEVVVRFGDTSPPADAPPEVAASTPTTTLAAPTPRVPDTGPPGPDLLVPAIVTAGVAVAFWGLGTGFAVWAEDRAQTYNTVCASMPSLAGCDAVLSEFDTAFGLEVASFVLAGLATAGSVVLFVVNAVSPSRPREVFRVATPCTIGPVGAACVARW